jgi:DNA-binding GntR family transcriptional regulator
MRKGECAVFEVRKHRPNLSDIAYDEIKEMIFSGGLAQGERIVLEKMSDQLNLSITPLREALNKLSQEDLIRVTPRSSYEVTSLNVEDIKDILDIRDMLETFALMTAGENLARFKVDAFRGIFAKLKATQNYRKFIEADTQFHESIINMSQNRKLWKLFTYIHSAQRILMVPSARIPGRIDKAIEEHLQILNAIERKDTDLAVKRLSAHIQRVKSLLLQRHQAKRTVL